MVSPAALGVLERASLTLANFTLGMEKTRLSAQVLAAKVIAAIFPPATAVLALALLTVAF
ncbi:hypothetical protein [Nostoc sp. TCL240-02]|uniref:hypothetical protein n=1 Tax=Nostoc sp. TCL240-02 TaxID=2572090 RepID=UPI00157FA232|nr:hypothetical protein [Nostoc sp. TCL240-02]QKQ74340.1 hypothetical protein FBB35_14320 [Nostoc sp. TCL240-02]